MSNGLFAQSILDWQAAAVAVFAAQTPALPAAQVQIGREEFQPDQNFYNEVQKNGFHVVIQMPEGMVDCWDLNGQFDVTAELFYPVPADISYPMTIENNMIAALVQGWTTNFSLWVHGGNRNPRHIKWEKPKARYHEKPKNVYSVKFVLSQQIAPATKVSTGYVFSPAV
jgi:hypothetical protein